MKLLRIISMALLAVDSVGALSAGTIMMIDPRGGTMGLKTEWLHPPFTNYFLPGLALMLLNGFGSCAVLISMSAKKSFYPILIILQGAVLVLWIIIEMNFFSVLSWLQPTMLLLGLGLVTCGYLQHKARQIIF